MMEFLILVGAIIVCAIFIYEKGHKDGRDYMKELYKMKANYERRSADANLIADAPLLLAEHKAMRDKLDRVREYIERRVDCMHWQTKDILEIIGGE